MSQLITKENITFILAVIGGIGTIVTGIKTFMVSRRKPQMQIAGHKIPDKKSLLIYVSLSNNSNQAVIISNISAKLKNLIYPCTKYPLVVLEESSRRGKDLLYHHEFYSMPFPITIPAQGGTSGYIFFEFPEVSIETDPTQMTFVIDSNRKSAIETTLPLGPQLR